MRTDAATPSLLSPELALVDSGLAGTARALMPSGGEGEIWRTRFPTRSLPAAVVPVVPPREPRREGPRIRLLLVAVAVCAAAVTVAYATGDGDKPYLVDDAAPDVGARAAALVPDGGVAATSISIVTTPAPTRPAPAP
jgi:hypothetical protein